jgi:hypothetical protein
MPPFGFELGFLTTLIWNMSSTIGPTVSMEILMRSFLLTCLLLEATLFAPLPFRIPISCTTSLRGDPVQESCI